MVWRLQNFANCYVIDDTAGEISEFVRWQDDLPRFFCSHMRERNDSMVDSLLESLSTQTSLKFTPTCRMIPVWHITERAR